MTAAKKNAEGENNTPEASSYDHKEGKLTEAPVSTQFATRHSVSPSREPNGEDNGPIPLRGDPFAHQRDEKAAAADAKEKAKEDEKAGAGQVIQGAKVTIEK